MIGEVEAQRRGLASRLEAIAQSRSRRAAIAERSYWHPNGFAKLVLEEHAGWGQLRIHVWPSTEVDDDIHNHAWYYESMVVAGKLREAVYRETAPSAQSRALWRHSYPQVGPCRFLLTEPFWVHLAEAAPSIVHGRGDAAGGSPDHIHRFTACVAPAVTMLRVGPVLGRDSYVYRDTRAPKEAINPRPMTEVDVGDWVELALGEPSIGE